MKLDRAQIERLLPHRPPFLLVDKVVEGEPGVRCVALRTLTDEDFWFAGHFPGNPVMPGVLIVEALAQAATIAAASVALAGDGAATGPGASAAAASAAGPAGEAASAQTATAPDAAASGMTGKIGLFAGIDKVRFKRVVKPGDTLRLEAEITTFRGPVGKAAVKATVDGDLACRGELMFAIVDASAIAAGEARL